MNKINEKIDNKDEKYELYLQGLSDAAIGNKLNVSKSCIRKWRLKYELSPNFLPVDKQFLINKNLPKNEIKVNNVLNNEDFFNRNVSEVLFDVLKTINKKENDKQLYENYKNSPKDFMVCMMEHVDFGFYKDELKEIQKMISEGKPLSFISKKLHKDPFSIILYMLDMASKKRIKK